MKKPEIELSECIRCGVCEAVCPQVFHLCGNAYVRIAEMAVYPEAAVDEAIRNCPVDCIYWDGD